MRVTTALAVAGVLVKARRPQNEVTVPPGLPGSHLWPESSQILRLKRYSY